MLTILTVATVIVAILLSVILGFLVLTSRNGSSTGRELEFDSVDNSIIAASTEQKESDRVETPETSLLFSEMVTLQSSLGELTVLERKPQSHSLKSPFRSAAAKRQTDAERLRQAQEELQRDWEQSIEFDETEEMSTLLDDSQRRPSTPIQPPTISKPPPSPIRRLQPTPSLPTPYKAPSKQPASVSEASRRKEKVTKGKAQKPQAVRKDKGEAKKAPKEGFKRPRRKGVSEGEQPIRMKTPQEAKAPRPVKPAKTRPSDIPAAILSKKERTRSEIIGVEPEALTAEGIPVWLGPTAPMKKPLKPKRYFQRKGHKPNQKRRLTDVGTDGQGSDQHQTPSDIPDSGEWEYEKEEDGQGQASQLDEKKGKKTKAPHPGKPAKTRPSDIPAAILSKKERARSEIIGVEPEATTAEGIPVWLGPTAPMKKPLIPTRYFQRKGNKPNQKRGLTDFGTDGQGSDQHQTPSDRPDSGEWEYEEEEDGQGQTSQQKGKKGK